MGFRGKLDEKGRGVVNLKGLKDTFGQSNTTVTLAARNSADNGIFPHQTQRIIVS